MITLCLMSMVPTCTTSTCKWRSMERGNVGLVDSRSGGLQQPRAVPPSWYARAYTVLRTQAPKGRSFHSTATETSASVQSSSRPPMSLMMWMKLCSWFSARRAGLDSQEMCHRQGAVGASASGNPVCQAVVQVTGIKSQPGPCHYFLKKSAASVAIE